MRPQPISFAGGGVSQREKRREKNQARKTGRVFFLSIMVREKQDTIFLPVAIILMSSRPLLRSSVSSRKSHQVHEPDLPPSPLDVFSDCQLTREKKEREGKKRSLRHCFFFPSQNGHDGVGDDWTYADLIKIRPW